MSRRPLTESERTYWVLFGARVRSIRKATGWTLEYLAKRMDTHKGYLSHVESGNKRPSLYTVELLAAALEVQVEDLRP